MPAARSSAPACTRVSAADAAGCCTVGPLAFGSAVITASAADVRESASTPAFATRLRAVPSAWRNRATSRWIGSVAVLPAVVAASWAASIASRLRVVNFSAPNWLMAWLLLGRSTSGTAPSVLVTSTNAPEVESVPLNSGDFFDPPDADRTFDGKDVQTGARAFTLRDAPRVP